MFGGIRKKDGYILVTTLIALAVVALLATAALGWASSALRLSRRAVTSEQAFYLANGGIEEALARVMAGQSPTTFSQTMTVAPGLTGTYSVTVTTEADKSLTVTSTGKVSEVTRIVTARMLPGTSGGGTGPDPGGGSTPGTVPLPPGVPAQVYTQAIYSNGSLAFNNNSIICGDMYSTGSVVLDNNSQVKGSVGSGCTSVVGTGKVVANGLITLGNGAVIAGGWCDALRYNSPGHPCATRPALTAQPVPDPSDLLSQATVRLPASQTLTGTKTYQNDLVYINGDLTINGVAISGTVTYAVTGKVYLWGNLTCAGNCSVAILSRGDQTSANNLELWATLLTPARIALGNKNTIHGNLQAGTFDAINNSVLYPLSAAAPSGSTPGSGPALTGWSS